MAARFPVLATADLHFTQTSAKLQAWLDELRCKQGHQVAYKQAVHIAAGPLQLVWTRQICQGRLCFAAAMQPILPPSTGVSALHTHSGSLCTLQQACCCCAG